LSFINSLAYSLGYETPKLINIVLVGNFLILFYALVRRFSGPLAAMLCTLLVFITPEMFAHVAFSLTNYPSAIFSSIAIIYFYIFFQERDPAYAILSCLFLSGSMMIRSDNVVFIMAVTPIIALMIYKKEVKVGHGLAYLALPVLIFFAWNLYIKYVIGIEQNSFFVKEFTWDGEKFDKLWKYVFGLITNKSLYGLSFYAFFTFLIINIYFLIKKDMWAFIFMFMVALIPYTMIYYFIEDEAYLFAEGGGWLASGYKRGLFSYIPLAWFYVFVSKGPSLFFKFIEEKIFEKKVRLIEQKE
ncbi:MAG TPA: glycosyltransferase family 39 protein, partial [Saprospiraceae bacterium]|nr:glycosyltransferase family 39 protein [Saprospiraceae bacterium]